MAVARAARFVLSMESAAQRSGDVNAGDGLSIGHAQELMALSTLETSALGEEAESPW